MQDVEQYLFEASQVKTEHEEKEREAQEEREEERKQMRETKAALQEENAGEASSGPVEEIEPAGCSGWLCHFRIRTG